MAHTHSLIQFSVVLAILSSAVGDSCPDDWPPSATSGSSSCDCEYRNGALDIIKCSSLNSWPTSASESATKLIIENLRMSDKRLKTNLLGSILPNLESFVCKECGISGIESLAFFGLRNLQELDLEKNNIIVVSKNAFIGLSNMRTLSLKDSKVATIQPKAFFNVRFIKRLDLSNNPLTEIEPGAFSGLSDVEQLILNRMSNNALKPYSLQGLKNVSLLSFHFSEIESIEPYAFFGIDNISTISFASSHVARIKPLAFVGIGQVNTISFLESRISTLECDVLLYGLNCVRNIKWQDIPLRCDCNLQWMIELSANISRDLTQNLTCASPRRFSGRVPMDLRRNELGCDSIERYAGCAPLDTRIPRVQPLERFLVDSLGDKYSSSSAKAMAFNALIVAAVVTIRTFLY